MAIDGINNATVRPPTTALTDNRDTSEAAPPDNAGGSNASSASANSGPDAVAPTNATSSEPQLASNGGSNYTPVSAA
jgi:hypothetical protein